jgi:arabinan endo-1,5-alpha-L-arabinosidase
VKTILALFILLLSFEGYSKSKQIIVHDPVVIESDGKYYMFSTGVGIASWYSDDLVNWNFLTQVFTEIPTWAKEEVPKFDGNIWAPDVSFHNDQYYLYYSISSFASNRSCIGVATNTTLNPQDDNYLWVDHGPIIESVVGRDNWNAIDPNLIFDETNQPWLSFGSFWGGLKMVKLNNDLLSLAKPQVWHTIAARERDFDLHESDPGNAAIEAPFIHKKDDYYYLFVSYDLCCRGSRSTYNVRVGRSKNIEGPYVDKSGTLMTQGGGELLVGGDDEYYGIGHNSVYTFEDETYMFSHGYEIADNGKPKLLIHKLVWDNESWPQIESAIDK